MTLLGPPVLLALTLVCRSWDRKGKQTPSHKVGDMQSLRMPLENKILMSPFLRGQRDKTADGYICCQKTSRVESRMCPYKCDCELLFVLHSHWANLDFTCFSTHPKHNVPLAFLGKGFLQKIRYLRKKGRRGLLTVVICFVPH